MYKVKDLKAEYKKKLITAEQAREFDSKSV